MGGCSMKKTESGSVTHWINELVDDGGKAVAQQAIWDRYFHRLAQLARQRLPSRVRRISDEEDVALSALDSFFHRAADGQFPKLTDRTGLWPLLARITVCKVSLCIDREWAAKRGGGNVLGERELRTLGGRLPSLDEVLATDPSPAFAAQMAEQIEILMGKLDHEQLREIARLKLEGHENQEIASQLNIGVRTVERKLARIRSIWASDMK